MKKENNAWETFKQKARPVLQMTGHVFRTIGRVLTIIGKWIMRLHKIFLAIPVVYGALRIAVYAREKLPESVGLMLQENGEYAMTLAREAAIQSSMAVTAICLLMMFISRRTIYPWIISIFSLVIPIVLIITNTFPT